MNVNALKKTANEVRKGIIESTYNAKCGHPGGSLSCADIITYLYFEKMNIKVDEPKWDKRDRFVLSKGHCAPALYAVLAEVGFIPKEDLKTVMREGLSARIIKVFFEKFFIFFFGKCTCRVY